MILVSCSLTIASWSIFANPSLQVSSPASLSMITLQCTDLLMLLYLPPTGRAGADRYVENYSRPPNTAAFYCVARTTVDPPNAAALRDLGAGGERRGGIRGGLLYIIVLIY